MAVMPLAAGSPSQGRAAAVYFDTMSVRSHHDHSPVYLEQLRVRNPGRLSLPVSAAVIMGRAGLHRLRGRVTRLERLAHAWREAAGETLAAASEVSSCRHGDIRITVTSPALAHEVSVYRMQELVEGMNRILDGRDRVYTLKVKTGRLGTGAM